MQSERTSPMSGTAVKLWAQTKVLSGALLACLLGAGLGLSPTPAQAQAPTEIIHDNGSAAYTSVGPWVNSTAVPGYYGANYATAPGGGDPAGTLVVDNTSAGFSTTGVWPVSTAVSAYVGSNYATHAGNGEPPSAIVSDNPSGVPTGVWTPSTAVGGYVGSNYQVAPAGTGANSFAWSVGVGQAGSYAVYARWTAHPNRATNARYTVSHAGGSETVTVNQQANSASWQLLGTYALGAAGSIGVVLSDEANGYVIADAVKVQPVNAAPNTASWTVSLAQAKTYRVYARWTQHPNRATDAKYTVSHAGGSQTVVVNQEVGGGQWNLLGTYAFGAGAATVTLTDEADGYVIADAVRCSSAAASAKLRRRATASKACRLAMGGNAAMGSTLLLDDVLSSYADI